MHKSNGIRSKCTMQLPLTPTTIKKMRKTSKAHKVKKVQQNVNPKTHKTNRKPKIDELTVRTFWRMHKHTN
jgi:hypothetical protein